MASFRFDIASGGTSRRHHIAQSKIGPAVRTSRDPLIIYYIPVACSSLVALLTAIPPGHILASCLDNLDGSYYIPFACSSSSSAAWGTPPIVSLHRLYSLVLLASTRWVDRKNHFISPQKATMVNHYALSYPDDTTIINSF